MRGAGGLPEMSRTTPFIHDVPAAEALAAWDDACATAGCPARVEAAPVPLEEAVGRVLAEPVWAVRSSPPFDAAAMDGIAVRAEATIGASETAPVRIEPDAYEVVDTGDPMPTGFDAVVMREEVHEVEGGAVDLRAAAHPYQHVRSIGEDVSATELLLPAGHRLRPVDVAAAGAAGAAERGARRLHGRGGGRDRHAGGARCGGQARAPGGARRDGGHTRPRRSGLSRL